MSKTLYTLSAAVLLLLTGCMSPTPQRFYSSPGQPKNQVARLWVDKGETIHASHINGKPVAGTVFGLELIEVLPGDYQVTIRSNMGESVIVPWHAEAGRAYEVGGVRNTRDYSSGIATFSSVAVIPARPVRQRMSDKIDKP